MYFFEDVKYDKVCQSHLRVPLINMVCVCVCAGGGGGAAAIQ